jgi:hypothetical protein
MLDGDARGSTEAGEPTDYGRRDSNSHWEIAAS